MKKSDGFTLIELLIGILCAALVTGAAMTLLLMGTRTNRAVLNARSEQQTVRLLAAMVESLAGENKLRSCVTGPDWEICGDTAPILAYSSDDQTIFSGDAIAFMDGVTSSSLAVSEDTLSGSLLEFTIQTEKNVYKISAYCPTLRSAPSP